MTYSCMTICYNAFIMSQVNVKTNTQIQRTSKLAVTSFIFGILSIFSFVLFPTITIIHPYLDRIIEIIPNIIALVLGIVSIIQIRKSPNLKGMGFGIAGSVIASPMLLFVILYFIMLALF